MSWIWHELKKLDMTRIVYSMKTNFKFSFSEKYKIDSFKMYVNLQDNTHDTWYFYFLSSMIFEVFESSNKYCQNNHSL
jgi:hypothetical protein